VTIYALYGNIQRHWVISSSGYWGYLVLNSHIYSPSFSASFPWLWLLRLAFPKKVQKLTLVFIVCLLCVWHCAQGVICTTSGNYNKKIYHLLNICCKHWLKCFQSLNPTTTLQTMHYYYVCLTDEETKVQSPLWIWVPPMDSTNHRSRIWRGKNVICIEHVQTFSYYSIFPKQYNITTTC
jgi:hypothetical protein